MTEEGHYKHRAEAASAQPGGGTGLAPGALLPSACQRHPSALASAGACSQPAARGFGVCFLEVVWGQAEKQRSLFPWAQPLALGVQGQVVSPAGCRHSGASGPAESPPAPVPR